MAATNTLCLNASFEPLRLMSAKRALRLVYQGKADLVEQHETTVYRSERASMALPVVIRLKKFVKVPLFARRKVTNQFLFARDNYTCQYCGRHESQLGPREGLNRDHVTPKSKGGANTWTNCVTSCDSCNQKKDSKSVQEAGMKLRKTPVVPQLVHLKWTVRSMTELQRRYITMFYGEAAVRGIIV